MLALLVACVLGQASSDQVLAQQTSLFRVLEADLHAKDQADPARLQRTRQQIDRLTSNELQTLVSMYQNLKQGATSGEVYSEILIDHDQSVMPSNQWPIALDQMSRPPTMTMEYGAGYAGSALIGTALYGGLPAARMVPGSYGGAAFTGGGSPLPFAGPIGFGTFTATGPVLGYGTPTLPGSSPWPMPFGP